MKDAKKSEVLVNQDVTLSYEDRMKLKIGAIQESNALIEELTSLMQRINLFNSKYSEVLNADNKAGMAEAGIKVGFGFDEMIYSRDSFEISDYLEYLETQHRELEKKYPVILRGLYDDAPARGNHRYTTFIIPRATANHEDRHTIRAKNIFELISKVKRELDKGHFSKNHVLDVMLDDNLRLYYDVVEGAMCFEESRVNPKTEVKTMRFSQYGYDKPADAIKAWENGLIDWTEWA